MANRKRNKPKKDTKVGNPKPIDKISIDRFGFKMEISDASWKDFRRMFLIYFIIVVVTSIPFILMCFMKMPQTVIKIWNWLSNR